MATRRILIHTPNRRDGRLFDPNDRDNAAEPFIYTREWFRQRGYAMDTSDERPLDDCVGVVFWEAVSMAAPRGLVGLAYRTKNRLLGRPYHRDMYGESARAGLVDRRVLVIWENRAITPENWDPGLHAMFPRVLTWSDELVDGGTRYRKLHWPQVSVFPVVAEVPYAERRLLTNVSMNKVAGHPRELYSAREATIRYFDRACSEDFDLYGYGWDVPPATADPATWQPFATYRGRIGAKTDVLPRYRFAICYENLRDEPGYVTEKIFDALRCGCVPVYWGAPNIDRYVDPGAFVDRRRFASDEELHRYLVSVDEAEFGRYREAMRDYLAGTGFARFHPRAFAEALHDALGLD